MKKQESVVVRKNSNPTTTESKVQITEDTICIVSFNVPGAFKERQSNANSKEEILKMKMSPILDENKKGRFICSRYGAPGRKLAPGESLPANYYVGSKEYKPYSVQTCTQRRVYTSESLEYLSSLDAKPYNIGRNQWLALSVKDRLEMQFAIDASSVNPINPSFTFEFVN